MCNEFKLTYKDGSSRSFHLIKCNTLITRTVGMLGQRQPIESNVFYIVPCYSIHTFFMPYSIDVIFVNRQLEIIKAKTVSPYRIASCSSAYGVFEGISLLNPNIPIEKVSVN